MEKFTILEIMQITGISKRTLHYYDSIGLLKPNKNKENGYRVYSKKDLIRLQQILFFKETGLELKEIAKVIDSGSECQKKVLNNQKALLEKKISKLEETLMNVKKVLNNEYVEIFDNEIIKNLDEQYAKEAEILYGDTAEYNYFNSNKANFDKTLEVEMENIYITLAVNIDKNPADEIVQKEISNLYSYMKKIMNCSLEVFGYICQGYVADPRFRSYFNKYGQEKLPEFILEASKVYIENNSK